MGQRALIKGNAYPSATDLAYVYTFATGGVDDRALKRTHLNGDGVKERRRLNSEAVGLQPPRHTSGFTVHCFSNGFEPFRTMKHRIKTGDIG